MTKFYTYRKIALAHRALGQVIKFTAGKGYYLFGKAFPKAFTMYDSVSIGQIPANAAAVAGYVNGRWPTFPSLASNFPHAKRLSIAVNAHADAVCLDVESGDATPDQAPAWVKRQLHRGVKKPVIYTSVSQAGWVLRELAKAGIPRSAIKLWTAHYTMKPHRCGPECGFGMPTRADATQYTDKALGKNLDASLCGGRFLG